MPLTSSTIAGEIQAAQNCCCFQAFPNEARRLHVGKRVDADAFQGVRAIGALQVTVGHFFYHFARRTDGIDAGGGNAVLIFFVMSGFVMTIGYAGKAKDQPVGQGVGCCGCSESGCAASAFQKEFWARRLARIGPVYWLSLAIALPISYLKAEHTTLADASNDALIVDGEFDNTLPKILFGISAVLSPFFLQGWVGPGGLWVNGPLWTVCGQWLFYLCFPCLINKLHTPRSTSQMWKECAMWWGIYAAAWCATISVPMGGGAAQYLNAHIRPENKLPLCLLGVIFGSQALCNLGGECTAAEARMWACYANGATAVVFAIVAAQCTAFLVSKDLSTVYRLSFELVLPAFYAFWLYALTQAPKSLGARVLTLYPLRKLGEWSFSWYCLHWPVLELYTYIRMDSSGGPTLPEEHTRLVTYNCTPLAPGLPKRQHAECDVITQPREPWGFFSVAIHPERHEQLLYDWEIAIVLPMILLAAVAAYYLVEKPCRTCLYKRLRPAAARSQGTPSGRVID